MKTIATSLLIVICLSAQAQKGATFRSQNYVGMLEGEQSSKFQLQTINGIYKNKWFAGVGTGLDYYYFRSVPLFLSVNRYLCDCDRTWFLSLDGGVNWVWDKSTANWVNNYRYGRFEPGLYWASGIGYKMGLRNKKDAVLLNVGFSAKHVREEVKSVMWCLVPPCPETTDKYQYKLNRVSLRVGWEF
jgi:hypothetical protein